MSEKILFVDDDPNLLAAMGRNLGRQFDLDIANGGETALAKIDECGPYAVVVSDRQMPRMDGTQFLSTVRRKAPDTVRMMLTGNVDLEQAVRTVNEGNIFRFLIKPCSIEVLAKALEDALTQYRLITAERDLLTKTLNGSIKLLTDILALADTKSSGQAEKLRKLITEISVKMPLENLWELHLAAMLSPMGYVTLPPETIVKARNGGPLSKKEQELVNDLPAISARLIANIPRLHGVSQIIRYQHKHFDGSGFPVDATAGQSLPLGARLLKILTDMMQLQADGKSEVRALEELQRRKGFYDSKLLDSVCDCFGGRIIQAGVWQTISIESRDLAVGMVLASDILTKDGTLVLAAGHHINPMILEKLRNFDLVFGLQEPVMIKTQRSCEGSFGSTSV